MKSKRTMLNFGILALTLMLSGTARAETPSYCGERVPLANVVSAVRGASFTAALILAQAGEKAVKTCQLDNGDLAIVMTNSLNANYAVVFPAPAPAQPAGSGSGEYAVSANSSGDELGKDELAQACGGTLSDVRCEFTPGHIFPITCWGVCHAE